MERNPEFDVLAAEWGIHFGPAVDYFPESWRKNDQSSEKTPALGMDALPTLSTTQNAGIPAFLTTVIDPNIIPILFAPNKAAEILGEVRKGSWEDQTAMFPVVERVGEVSSYGDWNNNGTANVNVEFPQRQSYLYQTMPEWGDLQMARAGRAKIGWAAEIREAAIVVLNKFQNLTYFFGVNGLQNYGLLNDPSLSAMLTPSIKAAGGTKWVTNGVVTATANEVYQDLQTLFNQLVAQTGGLVEQEDVLIVGLSPTIKTALTATNSFAVNVNALLKENFPNMKFVSAVQYGALTASNPQGVVGGNVVQMLAPKVDGIDTGYAAFNEKLRSFPIVRYESYYRQKLCQGSWGAVLRVPAAYAQMQGV